MIFNIFAIFYFKRENSNIGKKYRVTWRVLYDNLKKKLSNSKLEFEKNRQNERSYVLPS